MPQNQSSNKFSSFIGIILLLGIIGFTIFINFFIEEPTEEIVEEVEIIEEPGFSSLDSTALANLQKLKSLQADIIYEGMVVFMDINRSLGSISGGQAFANYGTLSFENFHNEHKIIQSQYFEIINLNTNYADSVKLTEIGKLFIDYQIESITTHPKLGDFTKIELKDGRKLFLIKENAEVKDNYYKELLENSEYLNDSTRIVLPAN